MENGHKVKGLKKGCFDVQQLRNKVSRGLSERFWYYTNAQRVIYSVNSKGMSVKGKGSHIYMKNSIKKHKLQLLLLQLVPYLTAPFFVSPFFFSDAQIPDAIRPVFTNINEAAAFWEAYFDGLLVIEHHEPDRLPRTTRFVESSTQPYNTPSGADLSSRPRTSMCLLFNGRI